MWFLLLDLLLRVLRGGVRESVDKMRGRLGLDFEFAVFAADDPRDEELLEGAAVAAARGGRCGFGRSECDVEFDGIGGG